MRLILNDYDLRRLIRGDILSVDGTTVELEPLDPYRLGIIVGEGIRDMWKADQAETLLSELKKKHDGQ